MELFKLFGSIFVNTTDAENSISRVDGKAENFANKLGAGIATAAKWGAAVTAAVGAAAVAVGTKAINAAANAETAFAKVNTLLTGNEKEITDYYSELKKASSETGVAFENFSEAVYQSISASVDQKDAIDFTTKAVKLAKGGFTETATAVDILTTAINAYGLSAEDADHISNALITTQNLGKTSVNELASSMGKVIPLASAYNVDIDNLTAGYAELTKGGIATAEATTYMKSMFSELAKNGSKVSDVLKDQTGKSFSELMGEGKSLGEVLDIIKKSVNGDATAFAGLWSSTEAGTGALALTGAGVEAFNSTLDAMRESAGATEQAYKTVTDTFQERTERLKTNVTNIMISLGETLLPYVEKAQDYITEHLPEIENFLDKFFTFFGECITKAAESAAFLYGKFAEYFPAIQEKTTTALEGIISIWENSLKPVFNFMCEILSTVKDAFLEGFGLADTSAGEAFQNIARYWDEHLKPCFVAINDFIQNILLPVWKIVFENRIAPIIKTCFALIGNYWNNVLLPVFTGIIDFITGVFSGDWEKAFHGIISVAEGILNGLEAVFKAPFEIAKTIVKGAIDTIRGFFDFEWKLPDLKLPHFSIDGSFSLNPPSVPHLSVDWYKKAMDEPMIMEKPTAFGINSAGEIMAGGEAGSEVVSGTNTLMNMISAAVQNQNAALENKMEQIVNILSAYMPKMANMQIVTETGALVGAIAPAMDAELGRLAKRNERGV